VAVDGWAVTFGTARRKLSGAAARPVPSSLYQMAVDGWAVTFGTARRGLGGAAARPVPSSLYQM